MISNRVELLAPAGNYDSFIGAINAGADAVYVGGNKFSARAFAENFDTETLCACIKYAHLFGRRVYLTLNTLIKESEFLEIYDYVKPFYEAGLDGVIIQDFGVLRYLKAHFPHMELHASTQMAITGPEFVKMCKELGVSRVVPARELSIEELKAISDAGIEVECFIHGAMCYCYSGMCLMSSVLGGRSGNRGRCAQPCRLPYEVSVCGKHVKDVYTLSLKDMCTIEHIPTLIEAGMSSFKIEGRMKRSEYAAGVTALYRKYIDAYYDNPNKALTITDKDKEILEHLYIRSQLHDGYLMKHNGKEMVTLDAPNYNGVDDEVLADINQKYLGYTQKINISMYGYFKVGQKSVLTLCTDAGESVSVSGTIVDEAKQAPATEETVLKQLSKFGNTHFSLTNAEVVIDGNVFLPNGMLNALRREAVALLENAIIEKKFPEITLRNVIEDASFTPMCDNSISNVCVKDSQKISVLVKDKKQLIELIKHPILNSVNTLYLEEDALDFYLKDHSNISSDIEVAYAMPYVLRGRHLETQRTYLVDLFRQGVQSVLVRNVEELSLALAVSKQKPFHIITDASLYGWNKNAIEAYRVYANKVTLPFELNAKEMRPLRNGNTEQIIYGYLPLMITANCIFKTNASCQRPFGTTSYNAYLKDRYGKTFTAVTNCKYCYNIIYNSVPLSLHKKYNKSLPGSVRLQFSVEEPGQIKSILDYYMGWLSESNGEFPVEEYTTVHENRQVE